MNTASLSLPLDRAAPRKRVLVGLGATVLLAHLGFLSGGLSGLSLDMFVAPDAESSASDPASAPAPNADTRVAELPAELPEPVRTSRVRWIVPKAPEPEPPPPPPPVVVKPPPPPEPVVVPEPPPAPVAEPELPPPTEVAVVAPPEPVAEPVVEPPVTPAAEPASDLKPGTEVAAGTVQGAGMGAADASLPPAMPPPNVKLRYSATASVKGSNYNGSGQLDWAFDGQQYEARLATRVLVFTVLEQTSVGRISPKGLSPDRFGDRRRSNERAAHFDRENQRVRYSNNAPDTKLLPGMQDRLSINFQLAGLFNARPDAYAEGQVLRLPVTSIDTAEVWLFQVGPQTTEALPAGNVVMRKLTRSPRREHDRKVEVWLMPEYAHLPGHIRITEPNGDTMDMRLQELPALGQETSNPP
jgi:Protein of unknown function (DUF3108)